MGYRIENGEALLQEGWDSILADESQERDVLTGLTGTYAGKENTLSDGAVMKVNLNPSENNRTLGLCLDLNDAGVQGAGKNLVGHTEALDTRKLTVYSNDVRHGVDNEMYGLFAHRNEKYGMVQKAQPKLSKWLKARKGKHRRQALLEGFSDNLVEAPTSQTMTWNKNWLVKNVAEGSQPTYDSTAPTFQANIQTALTAAGTGADALCDSKFFTYLEYWVVNKWKLEPMSDGSYVVLLPSRSAVYLKDIQNTGGYANIYKDTQNDKYIKAAYGSYITKIGKFHIIEDERAPVLNNNNNDGSLTAYYRDVGSVDNRSSYTNATSGYDVFDIGCVLGRSALIETTSMAPRFDDDISDFNRLKSIGMSTGYGNQVTEYDADTATDDTRINQNSAIIAFYQGTFTA